MQRGSDDNDKGNVLRVGWRHVHIFNVFCEKIPFGEFSHVFVGLFWVDSDVRIFSQLGFYDRRRACRASADVEREVSCVREMNATTVTAFS